MESAVEETAEAPEAPEAAATSEDTEGRKPEEKAAEGQETEPTTAPNAAQEGGEREPGGKRRGGENAALRVIDPDGEEREIPAEEVAPMWKRGYCGRGLEKAT